MAAIHRSVLRNCPSSRIVPSFFVLVLACASGGIAVAQQAAPASYPPANYQPANYAPSNNAPVFPVGHETGALNPSLEERIERLEQQSMQQKAQLTSLPAVGASEPAKDGGYVVGSDPA